MRRITDEYMQQIIKRAKEYSLGILMAGPAIVMGGAGQITWEHGRRIFSLREKGCSPLSARERCEGSWHFNAGIDRVKEIIDGDTTIRAGIFVYEIHLCRCFAGPVAGLKISRNPGHSHVPIFHCPLYYVLGS